MSIFDSSAVAEQSNRIDLDLDFLALARGENLFVSFPDRFAADMPFTFIVDELAIGSPERGNGGCIAAIERLFELCCF